MVRTELTSLVALEEDGDAPSSPVLPTMLLVSLSLVLLRAVWMAYQLITADIETGDPAGKNISRGVPFFVGALVNVLIRLGSAVGHGLLAINWVLAGAEPGIDLIACFVLVTINTQLLSSVALVVHLRSLLASVAISHQSRVRFQGISHLWGAPAGVACLALNGISTAILLAHLSERPERIVTWLATAGGFLVWANSGFRSVGLMDGQIWKEIAEAEDDSTVSVSDFMRTLGISLADTDSACAPPFWLQILRFNFKKDDELLVRHRVQLLRRAYPASPRLRTVHGAVVLLLGLLTTAVLSVLVLHCLSRVPLLRDVELVGGNYFPSLSPSRQDYYITVEDSGSNGISLIFQMELGEASRQRFCCGDAGCSAIEANDRASQLRLKLMISPQQFGTCQLQLIGLQSNTYNFTVLSLRDLSSTLNAEAEAPFPSYRAKQHLYDCNMVKPDAVEELRVTTTLQLDSRRIQPSFLASGALSGAVGVPADFALPRGPAGSTVTLAANLSQMTGALNVTLRISLLPEDQSVQLPSQITSNQYEVSVRVFTIEERLKQLLSEISELQGRIDANQEMSSQFELAQNLQKLEKATTARNELLRRAYRNQPPDTALVNSERLSFLSIGVTGTGKSELCRWMTGKLEECQSSDSMESHTSEIHKVQGHAFGDNRLQPLIEWIDTPGRGDTRGANVDTQLWNRTMSQLLARGRQGARIHRIVWVINAAWQRATELRNRMLQELRMSFGVDLYRNLVIMLNFLPHSANKTEYDEVKRRQKQKFVEWIMKREDEMFRWPEFLRRGVEEEVINLQVYGADINPKFLKDKPGDVAISAPYLHQFPPFSHPAGVSELMALVHSTWERVTAGAKGLLLDNPHPRLGPGKLEAASAKLSCNWQVTREEESNELELHGTARLEVEGKSLSPWDKAVIIPKNLDCGVRDPTKWKSFDWSKSLEAVALNVENTSSSFQTEDWSAGKEQKLCFCEAPACNETWRFGQEQALPALQCPSFRQKVNLKGIDAGDEQMPPFFLVSVQDRILGIPCSESQPAIREFHMDRSAEDGIRTTRHDMQERYRKKWRSSSVSAGRVVALDQRGEWLLVVDVNQDPLGFKLLQPASMMQTSSSELPYNGIVALEDRVYLVPGQVAHVAVVELKTDEVWKLELDPASSNCFGRGGPALEDEEGGAGPVPLQGPPRLREELRSKDKYCNQFAAPCIAEGKLFTPPWESQHYLVLKLDHPGNTQTRSETLFEVGNNHWGWSAFVEFNGIIYGSPYFERKVLVIDAKQHQKHLQLSPAGDDLPGNFYTALRVLNGHIFLAPGAEPAEPVILDPSTSSFWRFPEDPAADLSGARRGPKGGKSAKNARPRMQQSRRPRMQMASRRPRMQMNKPTKHLQKEQKRTKYGKMTKLNTISSHGYDDDDDDVGRSRSKSIEKLYRTVVPLGDHQVMLSPGRLSYMLILELFSGVNTTDPELSEMTSVDDQLKQLETH